MDVAISWQQGLYIKLSFRRGQQSFIFPITLSDGWNAGALWPTKGSLRTVDRAAAQATAEEVLQKSELTVLQRFVIYV